MRKSTFWHRYVLLSIWPPLLLKYLFGQAKNANVTAGFREPRDRVLPVSGRPLR